MEDVLDDIAGGRKNLQTGLAEFYFGGGNVEGLKTLVTDLGEIDAKELATFPVHRPDGEPSGIDLRVGRYGPYVEGPAEEGDADGSRPRANVPEDLPPDELTEEKARGLLANPAGAEKELGSDPDTGLLVVARNGRYGPYVTEVLPDDAPKKQKARTGSLFKDMSLDTVTLEQALRLLSLPRVVGKDPESGEEITAQNGRYGPYLKKGTDSRSLESEDQIFDITLDQALAIYAQPKTRGRQAASAPLKELGEDPVSGKPVVVKAGRFGEYVTDGEYNATLRKDDSVESVTLERAAELLAERRAKGPAKKSAKRGAKKTTKKSTAKKTTKKTTAKKTAKKS
jgi:DNA topoisomerase-1